MPSVSVPTVLGTVAAGASLASSLGSMTGGSGANGTYGGNPATYIPTAQPGADALYQDIFNGMYPQVSSLPGQAIPGYQAAVSNIQNNPYATGAQTGANATGAGDLSAAGSLYGAGNTVLSTGFDPQSALYNQSVQKLTDQFNASNAANGVSGPYAAGVTDQGLTNFNIDWQNQQLARQQQAIQSAGQAYSGAGTIGAAGASLPYNTYLGNQQNDLSALNSLSAGYNASFGPEESLANLLQSYLGLGQSATGLAQAGQANSFNQGQVLGQNAGQALSSLGTLFGNSNTGGVSDPGAGFMGTIGNLSPNFGNTDLGVPADMTSTF